MTIARLTRGPSTDEGVFGFLAIDDVPVCVTCELPWKSNRRNKSCIPAGTYEVAQVNSPKFGNVWEVKNVPGRSNILIHAGNNINDIEGCILVGQYFDKYEELPSVMRSGPTMMKLRALLGTKFTLIIE